MKTFIQMMLKCTLFVLAVGMMLFHLSDQTILKMKSDFLSRLIQPQNINTDQVKMILTAYPTNSVENEPNESMNIPVIKKNRKRIYLYNTHQTEEYIDGLTVFEVTAQFAEMLSNAGFEVVFETSDFMAELNRQNLKYNQLYTVSRKYLAQALQNQGEFDLIIDVHRDSASRSVSVVEKQGIAYGRLMFVIGNKSSNAQSVAAHSRTLTDKMNQSFSGIMREPFIRQSVYNQDMREHMLLLEVGSDQNTSSEVLRSLEILVEVLKKEGL